jgi:Kef-type K+ transport system membrane component KefB
MLLVSCFIADQVVIEDMLFAAYAGIALRRVEKFDTFEATNYIGKVDDFPVFFIHVCYFSLVCI